MTPPGPNDHCLTLLTTSGEDMANSKMTRSKTSNVVTLEAYSPDTSRSSKYGRMRKENAGKIEITPGNFEPNSYVKYLVLKI